MCKGLVVGDTFDELRRGQHRHSGRGEHGKKYTWRCAPCKASPAGFSARVEQSAITAL